MSEFRIDQIKSQDATRGPDVAGITTFTGTSGIVMPSGDTAYRGGRGRGVWTGGYAAPANNDRLEYVTIATTGNATDFGNLTSSRHGVGSSGNSTKSILAGGSGSRLNPITKVVSKQLLPIYDKPMIYYPVSTLMLANIKEILVITTRRDIDSFKKLLGDGNSWGIDFSFKIQDEPQGIAEAFLIGKEFINNSPCALILGDNLFHGAELIQKLNKAEKNKGATIFLYPVKDPQRYGIAEFDNNQKVISITEKPSKPKSKYAITGLYFYDEKVVNFAESLTPSKRGELEITDINQLYLNNNNLTAEILSRGSAWLDTGTFDSLSEAGTYIQTLEKRQGLKIGCPEEIAWNKGWISDNQLEKISLKNPNSEYSRYLKELLLKEY